MSGVGRPAIDITGRRFGRLVVMRRSARRVNSNNEALWDCRCDCGATHMTLGRNLRRGHTRSCGCYRAEFASIKNAARTQRTV